jgi:hypothetical protein
MLSKTTEIDKIEIVGSYNMVHLREATVVSEDGTEISRSFHRRVLSPVDSAEDESDAVKAIKNIVHTQDVIDAYASHLASISSITEELPAE